MNEKQIYRWKDVKKSFDFKPRNEKKYLHGATAVINSFQANVPSLYLLMFSSGTEMDHRLEMG